MPLEAIKSAPIPSYIMIAYARNAKAIGVLWAIFTVCYAIVAVLVFFQPYWLGSTDQSEEAGVFGLYQYCTYSRSADVSVENCRGEVADYHHILSPFFKASTVLVGMSAVIILLCIAVMTLFLCIRPEFVFTVCAYLQLISFVCLLVGCVVYPAGWDNAVIKGVCGQKASKYSKGACELRWSYILAVVGVFDLLFLSVLAFILASKQLKRMPTGDQIAFANMPLPLNFQPMPVLRGPVVSNGIAPRQYAPTTNGTVGRSDRASQFSIAPSIKPSNRARAEYAASVQNFQL